jgi:diadenosine tetraphosphatase ApaH/serine/threonine PP2A family protein phosphatase
MKWFILADIHANLPALKVVLEDIEKQCPGILSSMDRSQGKIISIGDQIGYNPYPNEVMDTIWSVADEILIGNHEMSVHDALTQDSLNEDLNTDALWAVHWTADNLNKTNKDRLKQLIEQKKYQVTYDGISFVHGSPDAPKKMSYIFSGKEAQSLYFHNRKDQSRICFVGHTHEPKIFTYASKVVRHLTKSNYSKSFHPKIDMVNSTLFPLGDFEKALNVVPSVGQPRDGSIRSGYAIYDQEANSIELVRLIYRIDKVQSDMERLGFPWYLINRLNEGE